MAKEKKKSQQQTHIPSTRKNLFIGLSLIGIIISAVYSYKLKWLGDDIFIAFRYVQNFVAGNGLVYNIGERVEGFTDFLWIMLISLFAKLHFDVMNVSIMLGIFSSLGTLIIFTVIGFKLCKSKNAFILPFITLALALNYDYNVWATSGLETSFYSFLLSMTFYIYFFSGFTDRKRFIISGTFLNLAMMTRPDAMLILVGVNGLMILYHLLQKTAIRSVISTLLLFNLALIIVYIPYFIWRYQYYGFIFPNTYYDKLGGESLFSKGFYYLWLYFKPHFTSFLILLLPPFVFWPILKKGPALEQLKLYLRDRSNAAFVTCILVIYAYLLVFVAKVGGDFMHARFIIPIAPFMYYIILHAFTQLVSLRNLNIVLSVLLICSFIETQIRSKVFEKTDETGKTIITLNKDVADERYVYTKFYPIENEIKMGKALHTAFQGIDAKLLIRGGQACMGYFANFTYIQEYHGLTDTLIAHSKIEHRSRIGHEKHASYTYLQEKGIHFLFNRSPLSKDRYKYAQVNIPPYSMGMEIITYDQQIIEQLSQRLGEGFKYTNFQLFLDDYILRQLPAVSKSELQKDYDAFYSYYFKHNEDKIRQDKFLNALK